MFMYSDIIGMCICPFKILTDEVLEAITNKGKQMKMNFIKIM